jgi:hypothetical protein
LTTLGSTPPYSLASEVAGLPEHRRGTEEFFLLRGE